MCAMAASMSHNAASESCCKCKVLELDAKHVDAGPNMRCKKIVTLCVCIRLLRLRHLWCEYMNARQAGRLLHEVQCSNHIKDVTGMDFGILRVKQ